MYDLYSFSLHRFLTYIIVDEIRVIFLNAVVQNGYHYTFPCVTLSPGFFSIQVLMHWVGLKDTAEFYLPANLLWLTRVKQ